VWGTAVLHRPVCWKICAGCALLPAAAVGFEKLAQLGRMAGDGRPSRLLRKSAAACAGWPRWSTHSLCDGCHHAIAPARTRGRWRLAALAVRWGFTMVLARGRQLFVSLSVCWLGTTLNARPAKPLNNATNPAALGLLPEGVTCLVAH
jgi:hypothetical protein